jgi:putative ABC transport system ATP-binding protein
VPRIIADSVELSFGAGPGRTHALQGVNLTIEPGGLTMITGPSGSGKTSLLTVLGALLAPDRGRVLVDGLDLGGLSASQRTRFRKRRVGFVFQSFRLMDSLTADENVRMSLAMRGVPEARTRSVAALAQVGLRSKLHLKPSQLSGGERQRVAVARALAHDPDIIFADEPTASLDRENGLRIGELLALAAQRPGRSVVVVSHDDRLTPFAKRVVRMEDGQVLGGA